MIVEEMTHKYLIEKELQMFVLKLQKILETSKQGKILREVNCFTAIHR